MSSKRNSKKGSARKEGHIDDRNLRNYSSGSIAKEENDIHHTSRLGNEVNSSRGGTSEKRPEKDASHLRWVVDDRPFQGYNSVKHSSSQRDLGEPNWRLSTGKQENQPTPHLLKDTTSENFIRRSGNFHSSRAQGSEKYEYADNKRWSSDRHKEIDDENFPQDKQFSESARQNPFLNKNAHLLDGQFRNLATWHSNRFQEVASNFRFQQEGKPNGSSNSGFSFISYYRASSSELAETNVKDDFINLYEQAMERYIQKEKSIEKVYSEPSLKPSTNNENNEPQSEPTGTISSDTTANSSELVQNPTTDTTFSSQAYQNKPSSSTPILNTLGDHSNNFSNHGVSHNSHSNQHTSNFTTIPILQTKAVSGSEGSASHQLSPNQPHIATIPSVNKVTNRVTHDPISQKSKLGTSGQLNTTNSSPQRYNLLYNTQSDEKNSFDAFAHTSHDLNHHPNNTTFSKLHHHNNSLEKNYVKSIQNSEATTGNSYYNPRGTKGGIIGKNNNSNRAITRE